MTDEARLSLAMVRARLGDWGPTRDHAWFLLGPLEDLKLRSFRVVEGAPKRAEAPKQSALYVPLLSEGR